MAAVDLSVHIPGAVGTIDIATGKDVENAVVAGLDAWKSTGHPVQKRSTFSGTVNAGQGTNQLAYFPFDIHPQVGRLWSIRKIMIASPTARPFATSALSQVTCAIFATGQPVGVAAGANPPPDIDAAVTGLTVPTTQFFAPHQITIRGALWLVIGFNGSGVSNGVAFFGHADLIEIDDDPRFLLDL
jgi:hypothetical protein